MIPNETIYLRSNQSENSREVVLMIGRSNLFRYHQQLEHTMTELFWVSTDGAHEMSSVLAHESS